MSQVFELLVSGLSLGCIYALIAMGFVIVFKATNVVNFAHASVLMLGAYLVARWNDSLGFFGALLAAGVVCAIAAAAIDVVLVRPLRRRRGGIDALAILTIGINVVIATELTRQVGTDILPTGAPWGSDTLTFLGITVPQTRIAAAAVAILLMIAFAAAFKYSDWGVAMRSTAADPETAALMGIRLSRVAAGAWAVSGLLAAIAGAFFTSFPASGVNTTTYLLALTAIPAAVLGGLDSIAGAVVGGLVIGVAITFTAGYQDELSFLGRGLSEVVPYIVLLAVLLWRPSGLFGTREITVSNPMVKRGALAVVVVLLLIAPYFLEGFWLQVGLFSMSAAIGAIGLTLLVGITGQLSLAHAFFVAIGAYGYCYLAGGEGVGVDAPGGLGLPPFLALIGAVLLAGLAGALFSPIAGRLRGIYLGLASVGLIFIGQHILFNATGVTGGFNGRDATPFSLFGFTFSDSNPDDFSVFGVPYGTLERLWYLGLVLLALAWWYARNLIGSRPGRAMQQVRDSEVAAAVMGVNVPAYKAAAFTVSSMYAGLGGVFLALAFARIVPESFGFLVSIDFLVMIVIGGLGSVGGAVAGAVLITLLPQVLTRYSDSLPLVSEAGADGLQASQAARFLYGAAVVAVLIYAPQGLAGLSRRFAGRRRTLTPPTIQPKERTA